MEKQDGFVKQKLLLSVLCCAALADGQTAPVGIDQAVQEALEKNLDLAAQKWSVTVAEAREITAKLRPNPVLTVSGQTLDLLGANYSPSTPLGPNQYNFHTDFPIERGKKREERVAVAKEDKTLAELGVREMMRQVISSVQNGFVDVQQAKENLKLAQENLQRLEDLVKINEARLKSGDLAAVELDRSKVAALQYRNGVQQAQLQLDQARTQLQYLMGRKIRQPDFDVAGDLRREGKVDGVKEIAQLARQRRPDYLLNQEAQARSRADLRLQLANGKADYVIGTEVSHQRAWGVSGNSVGLYFSMPLRVFNRNQGEIARAQREIRQAEAQTVALENSIEAEVEKAYQQYMMSKQMLASIEGDILSRALRVRNTTEYSYRRGEASLVEFLDAQRAFNDAMQSFNEARASYARSLYQIDTVSGATVSGGGKL